MAAERDEPRLRQLCAIQALSNAKQAQSDPAQAQRRLLWRLSDAIHYEITQEVNRCFAEKLYGPVDVRTVSGALRHMKAARSIHVVRPGRAQYEALYVKGPRPAKG